MPLSINPSPTTECNFSEWIIGKKNRAKLIEIIAYLYLRQEENAQRVINALEPRRRVSKGRVAQNVVRKLTAPRAEDVELFQSGTDEQKEAIGHLTHAEWQRLDREMRVQDYPACHHSPEYEQARHPAYRVLPAAEARPLLESLPPPL